MIEAKGLTKRYHKGKANELLALDGVSFTIYDGELVAIIGKSGAGKSTLLHLLGCIDVPDDGELLLSGQSVSAHVSDKILARIRNRHIGLVLQDFALVSDYSDLENVMIPLLFSPKHTSPKKRKESGMEALETVGIADLYKKNVNQLSGGQRQRVAIARAMVNQPSLLLADEPTGALDEATGMQIMELFQSLHSSGRSVVLVTHDLTLAQQCPRVLRLADGKLISDTGKKN